MTIPDTYEVTWRDRLALTMINVILTTVATKGYAAYITGFIRYGMNAAVRDQIDGREPPRDYHEYFKGKDA